jgi:potassium/hydrogen antiporter
VLITGELVWWHLLMDIALELAVGAGLGVAIGFAGRAVLKRARLPAGGLYPVLTLALAFLAYGVPGLFHGSGFLAVYLAGVLIGNGNIRYRSGVLRVHDAVAWFAQVSMFLVLGLLIFPSELMPVATPGLVIGLVLAVVARPLAVVLCLLPFPYEWRERLYIGWVGLRGAVPIILATVPVLARAPGGREIFNIVFFVVVVNALVPGGTVPWLTRRLGLLSQGPPPPPAVLEISSTQLLNGEVVGFSIDPASAACGASIADLPFPPSATAAMIVRGTDLLAPKGNTVLEPGDHVYVFCRAEDLAFVHLIFGQPESE